MVPERAGLAYSFGGEPPVNHARLHEKYGSIQSRSFRVDVRKETEDPAGRSEEPGNLTSPPDKKARAPHDAHATMGFNAENEPVNLITFQHTRITARRKEAEMRTTKNQVRRPALSREQGQVPGTLHLLLLAGVFSKLEMAEQV